MFDEKVYSTSIWDYLGDMNYMPSRQDRDQLIQAEEENRVRIWDYFFRIDPNDVGKPQKNEMADINKRLSEAIAQHNIRQQEIRSRVSNLERVLFQKRLNSFFYSIASFLISGAAYKLITESDISFRSSYLCVLLPAIFGVLMWLSISFVGWDEKGSIKASWDESRVLSENRDLYVKKEVARKSILRAEIKALKKQIPTYPSDEWVREWLREDFRKLWEKSVEVTGGCKILCVNER